MGTTTQPASAPDINYTFNDEQLARLMAWGEGRRHDNSAVLSAFGERCVNMLVTLSGETHIFTDCPTGEVRRGGDGAHHHGQGRRGARPVGQRVASAVGEGLVTASDIHAALAGMGAGGS